MGFAVHGDMVVWEVCGGREINIRWHKFGRANHKIVIEIMHEVLNVIVGLQEPRKGIG